MCYNARFLLEIALRRARHNQNAADIAFYEEELKNYDDLHQVSGYSHPELIVYTNKKPYKPQRSQWGLIPSWAPTQAEANQIRQGTLNARVETLFEKASFKESAADFRCLIPAAGFYEHHHKNKKTFPYYIHPREDKPLMMAGLYSLWQDPEEGLIQHTCSIVTTQANSLMRSIHNNPKLPEPRMPLLLNEEQEELWLHNKPLPEVIKQWEAFPSSKLQAHTVRSLSGKNSPGNVPEAIDKYSYAELAPGLWD